MTILNPPISNVGAYVVARSHRALATAFIRQQGIVSTGDFAATGDPSGLSVNITAGAAYVHLHDDTYDMFVSDSVENRPITTAETTGARTDLLYLRMQSKEFGDPVNLNELVIKKNPSVGTGSPPAPDVINGASDSGVLRIASILVPQGAIRGNQCTITPLATLTAPLRDGGYTNADLAQEPYIRSGANIHLAANGTATIAHLAPFTPRAIVTLAEGPFAASGHLLHVRTDFINSDTYTTQWIDSDGTLPAAGTAFTVTIICFP